MKRWPKPCQLCHGRRRARCIICGWKKKNKSEMTEREKFTEYCWELGQKYLEDTRQKLSRFNMSTTRCRTLDLKIIMELGDWLSSKDRYKEELRYLIEGRLEAFINSGDGDVYADELHEMALRWVREMQIPEAFRVPHDERPDVVRRAVDQFIADSME